MFGMAPHAHENQVQIQKPTSSNTGKMTNNGRVRGRKYTLKADNKDGLQNSLSTSPQSPVTDPHSKQNTAAQRVPIILVPEGSIIEYT